MIGQRISPVLNEIEDVLWEFEDDKGTKPEYTIEGFRSGIKIFMSVLLDKMWELQEKENLSIEVRCSMAQKLGESVRKIVKMYTNIDTHSLYHKVVEDPIKLEEYTWTDESVIDFVNWYMKLHKLPVNYTLENQTILESFKKGDDPSVWDVMIFTK